MCQIKEEQHQCEHPTKRGFVIPSRCSSFSIVDQWLGYLCIVGERLGSFSIVRKWLRPFLPVDKWLGRQREPRKIMAEIVVTEDCCSHKLLRKDNTEDVRYSPQA